MGFIVPVLLGYVFLFSWNSNVDGASIEAVSRLTSSERPETAQNRTSVQNLKLRNETNSIAGSTPISTTLNLLQNENNTTLTNNSNSSKVEAVTNFGNGNSNGNSNSNGTGTISKNSTTVVVSREALSSNEFKLKTDGDSKNHVATSRNETQLKDNNRNVDHIKLSGNNSTSLSSKESLLDHPVRNVTNEENLVDTNSGKPISKNDFDRTDSSRSIDIKKYISPEFHNKNNVYKLPFSEETQRFLSFESEHPNKDYESYESTESMMTTTLPGPFDDFHNDFKDHLNDSEAESSNIKNSDHSLDDFFDRPLNLTKRKIEITKVRNVHSNDTEDENGVYSRKVSIEKTSMNYHMTFNDTEILDDDDHDSKEEKDFANSENSNSIKSGESEEKQDAGDENNSKEIESEIVQNVTNKPTIPYDLPPKQAVINKNESRTTVLTNSIIEIRPKNVKKDQFIPTYSPMSEEEPNKEHVDQYLLTDTNNKPIIIEKRGRIMANSNSTRSSNATRNSSRKIDRISENENIISYLGSTTTLPIPNTKKIADMNETESNHLVNFKKKDLVVEPVTNNYINTDLDSIKTTTTTATTKTVVTPIPININTSVDHDMIDSKTHNLITITTIRGNATTTVLPTIINRTTTSTASPLVTDSNYTTEKKYETTPMLSTTTMEPEITTVVSSEITTDSSEITTVSAVQSEEETSSSSSTTTSTTTTTTMATTTVDDAIFSYTTVVTDTPSTTESISDQTAIITNATTTTTPTVVSSPPSTEIRNSTPQFDTAETMVSYTTQISVSSSISMSSGKKANVIVSKETLEDIDVNNKDEIESKEGIDDDDDDIYDAPTTVSSSNDFFNIDKDHVSNDTWAKYENGTEERNGNHNFTSTLPTTIEILHVASVGSHQTTFTPKTFQPDHSYQTPQLVENNGKSVGVFTEIEELSEATTIAGSHEMGANMDGNGATIAAIVISCIGAVCLLLLAGLLIIIKRRHKRFNYGQRCTPVSLDAYSVDNVSVYNSVSRRKGLSRASKRSYGNPAFDDSCCTSNPLNFTTLTKFSGNREGINSEFDEIPQIFAQMTELPEGCDTKNRYANVIPLPETRVMLTPIDGYPNSDYINANFVTGPKSTKGYYIACQAPLQDTVDDFWRMVWEQNSRLILMLTNLYENHVEKCADYLPPSEVLDCHRLFGDFEVTLKKREVKEKYVISSLQLKNMVSNSWREVTHMWYVGWPEKGVPIEYNSIIAFLIEARSYLKLPNTSENPKINDGTNCNGPNGNGPVVVHCSPGTGRTGTVIACDMAIREFEQARQVDIPKLVYRLRRDRAGAVQTKDQYAFIYKVVSTYAIKLTGGVTLESI